LGTRAGAGRPNVEHADVFGIVAARITGIYRDILEFRSAISRFHPIPTATLHARSYLRYADLVPAGSIDLLITSPPYLNNYHYIRNTRPHLYWLGLVEHPSELKEIARDSFRTVLADGQDRGGSPANSNEPRLGKALGYALVLGRESCGAWASPLGQGIQTGTTVKYRQ